jgi:hypothetical protein
MRVAVHPTCLIFTGIFVGLYNPSSSNTSIEPFPEGTPVSFPLQSPHTHSHPIIMKGIVVSAPIHSCNQSIPLSDSDAPPYTIWLVDGSIHNVSPDFLASLCYDKPREPNKIFFPWLGNSQKVMFLHDGTY